MLPKRLLSSYPSQRSPLLSEQPGQNTAEIHSRTTGTKTKGRGASVR
jgi:hypothetical protein